jgi:hypothetical protein
MPENSACVYVHNLLTIVYRRRIEMDKTLTRYQAAQLAEAYHNIMLLVNHDRSNMSGGSPSSPRSILDRYLDICKECQCRLHNDAWLEYAQEVVKEKQANFTKGWVRIAKREGVCMESV